MVERLRVWVYRPDIEAQARKINPHFVFNTSNERYFDVLDREKEVMEQYNKLREKTTKKVFNSKIEVPCE